MMLYNFRFINCQNVTDIINMLQRFNPSRNALMRWSHLSCLITSMPRYAENTTPPVTGRDIAAVVPSPRWLSRARFKLIKLIRLIYWPGEAVQCGRPLLMVRSKYANERGMKADERARARGRTTGGYIVARHHSGARSFPCVDTPVIMKIPSCRYSER